MNDEPAVSPRTRLVRPDTGRTTRPDEAALLTVRRYASLRRRGETIPVHVRPAGSGRWSRGHAAWVHDDSTFGAGHRARGQSLLWVVSSYERAPTSAERWWIHRHGGDIVLGTLLLRDGGSVDLATRRRHGPILFGRAHLERAA